MSHGHYHLSPDVEHLSQLSVVVMPATATILGGVIPGANVTIDATGVISTPLASVFGRTGQVAAQAGDYGAFYPSMSGSYQNPPWIASLDYSKITGAPSAASLQTPWLSNIDAALYDLNNVGYVRFGSVGGAGNQAWIYNSVGMFTMLAPNGVTLNLESDGNGRILMSTSGTRRMVVHQSGNVGIGPAMNPSWTLDVQGDVNTNGVYRINGVPLATGGTPAAPTGSVQFNAGGAFGGSANLTWDDPNQRFAITGPTQDANAASNGCFSITDATNNTLTMGNSYNYGSGYGGAAWIQANDNSGGSLGSGLVLQPLSTGAGSIQTGVGIGVQLPRYMLDVGGDINSVGGQYRVNGGLLLYAFNKNAILLAQPQPNGNYASAVPNFIYDNNRLGVNQSNPAYTVDVTGDCNITGQYRINGVPLSTGGSAAAPTGSVQFNAGGAFGGSANLTWDNVNNQLTLAGLSATTNSQMRVGGLEFQTYAVNNAWIGSNLYYNGSAMIYRNAGPGGTVQFNGGNISFSTAATGAAGASYTAPAQMVITPSGNVSIGAGQNPGYTLTVAPATPQTNSQVNISPNGTDSGLYALVYSGSDSYLSSGYAYNNKAWIPKTTSGSMLGIMGGNLFFWADIGLTAGTAFNPTARMVIDTAKVAVLTGNLLVGGGTPYGFSGQQFHINCGTDRNLAIHYSNGVSGGVTIETANDPWNTNTPMELTANLFQFTNGMVGIATSPGVRLDVQSSGLYECARFSSNGYPSLLIAQNGGTTAYVSNWNGGGLVLSPSGPPWGNNFALNFYLNTSGNVGIKTSGNISQAALTIAPNGGYGIDIAHPSYGTYLYNDGGNFYFLLTNANDPYGGFNGLRPFYITLSNGNVNMAHNLAVGNGITSPWIALGGAGAIANSVNVTGNYYINGAPLATGGGPTTYRNMNGNYGLNTWNTNSTGKPVWHNLNMTGLSGGVTVYSGPSTSNYTTVTVIYPSGSELCASYVVPAGWVFYISVSGGSITTWIEWY